MDELISVGLDVGTTTTQLVVSQLSVVNQGNSFSVPKMEIARRELLYESPVIFTPLLGGELVDGEAIAHWVEGQYAAAGITKMQVDTGAVIITGETSRKENARQVLHALSGFAGDFVVATAGPDLESALSAKGAGATEYSEKTGKTVLHMDIGGGTSNLSFIENGKITATGCLNVGGRLMKFGANGEITYISPVLTGLTELTLGQIPTEETLRQVTDLLAQALEMAAGLREETPLLQRLTTRENKGQWEIKKPEVISFSGGVADCINWESAPLPRHSEGATRPWESVSLLDITDCHGHKCPRNDGGGALATPAQPSPSRHSPCHLSQRERQGARNDGDFLYGDLGVLLGRSIARSALCQMPHRLGEHTIRATVIGAGSHSAQISGSTVFCSGVELPKKNLPVAVLSEPVTAEGVADAWLGQDAAEVVLAFAGEVSPSYARVQELAKTLLAGSGEKPLLVCLEQDMAKALGHAIRLLDSQRPVLCIDRVQLQEESFLDIGRPVGPALPVVVKTLVLSV